MSLTTLSQVILASLLSTQYCHLASTLGASNSLPPDIGFTNFFPSGQNESSKSGPTRYIFGGVKAQKDEFPYIVSLRWMKTPNEGRHLCGGSILHPRWVLTARHCTESPERGIAVVLEGRRESTSVHYYEAEKVYNHPKGHNDLDADLSLVKLKEALPLGHKFRAIALSTDMVSLRSNEDLHLAGWGFTERGAASDQLLKTTVEPRSDIHCDRIYNRRRKLFNSNTMFCAGGHGRDSCSGDSGGPLVRKRSDPNNDQLIGIVSWGPKMCGKYPGVYVKVINFKSWIKQTMGTDYKE